MDAYETAQHIVEEFENFLEDHNIVVPNDDRPEDNNTPIYGCDYSDLVEDVCNIIRAYGA